MRDMARPKGGVPLLATCVVAALVAWMILFTRIPLGISGEWTWRRYDDFDFFSFELIGVVCGFASMALVAYLTDFRSRSRSDLWVGLLILVLGSMWIDYQIMLTGRLGGAGSVFVTLDRHATGYLDEAAAIDDSADYYGTFHERIKDPEGSVTHVQVHPPGNVALCHAVLACCRRWPEATGWITNTLLPVEVDDGLREARARRFFDGLLEDPAVGRAAEVIVMTMLVGLALGRGLALLVIRSLVGNVRGLGVLALVLAAIPSPILFLGHFDVYYYAWSFVCLAAFVQCQNLIAKRTKTLFAWSVLTGFCCGIGVLFSIGYGLLIGFFGLIFIIRGLRRPTARLALGGFLLGGGLVIALCWLAGVHIVEICFANLANNDQFFAETNLTWLWHLVNPLEFAVFMGTLLSTTVVINLRQCSPRRLLDKSLLDLYRPLAWLVFLFLVLHPSSRAELPRVGLLVMPILIAVGAADLATTLTDRRRWLYAAIAAGVMVSQIFLMKTCLRFDVYY